MTEFMINILYEDSDLWVIDKPSGVVVNRAESVLEATIQDWAEERCKILDSRFKNEEETTKLFLERSGIAHRLDKETSGCLIVAKNPPALSLLMQQFKARKVLKTYFALVHGKLQPREGFWRLPISRSLTNRARFRVKPGGKMAETGYQVINYYQTGNKETVTEVELKPKSGRTHQLRVHLSFLKHPVVSDSKYGNRRYRADISWCPRLYLHAGAITFEQPITHKKITAESPLPKDLSQAKQSLAKIST